MKNLQPNSKIHLAIKLNSGVELMDISSPSHRIKVTNHQSKNVLHKPFGSEQVLAIDVGNVQVAMDRDFILQWQPNPSNEPRLSVFRQKLDGEIYSLAMLLPPTQSNSTQDSVSFVRDITFIIDTSGSMQGQSIKQAKQSLLFALQTLKEQDSFNIISFESSFHQAFSATVMATQQNIFSARQFITNLRADGGTEMVKPLASALAMPSTSKQRSNAIKQVIFITDGAVSNEIALFKLIHDTPHIPRLFTVGIGSAPNGYFMRKAAQFGRGSYTYIGKIDEVKAKMSALLEKISRPALRNIAVQFQPLHLGSIEQYPKKIPDLYYGEPLTIAFKTAMMPNSMQLFGEQANKGWHQEVSLSKQQESIGITPIWARAKIEDLLDGLVTGKPPEQVRKNVLATSLSHQVMSPYSSFIAVEQEEISTSTDNKKQATAFPQTATGWQLPFVTGLLLLIFSLILQARRAINIAQKNVSKSTQLATQKQMTEKC
jgi:Ca-activated chloride channel family protein